MGSQICCLSHQLLFSSSSKTLHLHRKPVETVSRRMDFILSFLLMMVIVCEILNYGPVEFWSTRSSTMIFYFISIWLCFLHQGRVWWWTVTKLPPVGLTSRGTRCFCFFCLSTENMYWHCTMPERQRRLSGPSFLLVLFSAEKNHNIVSLSPFSLLNSVSLYKYWCFPCM